MLLPSLMPSSDVGLGRGYSIIIIALLPPVYEVCEGYVFTGVCLSTMGVSVSFWGGGLHPGGLCPGGLCPGGSPSRRGLCKGGSLSREVSDQGGFLSGGVSVQAGVSVRGGLCQGDSLDRDPPYGNERAVRILLECILVDNILSFSEQLCSK